MLAELSTSSTPIRMPIALRRVMTVKSPRAKRMTPSTTKWPSESAPTALRLHCLARHDDGADERGQEGERGDLEGPRVLPQERVPDPVGGRRRGGGALH